MKPTSLEPLLGPERKKNILRCFNVGHLQNYNIAIIYLCIQTSASIRTTGQEEVIVLSQWPEVAVAIFARHCRVINLPFTATLNDAINVAAYTYFQAVIPL